MVHRLTDQPKSHPLDSLIISQRINKIYLFHRYFILFYPLFNTMIVILTVQGTFNKNIILT
jgi:hypothetical protein